MMNNGRDCKHGRQVGKCDSCDLEQAEKRIDELQAERDALAAQVEHLCYQITNIALCYDNNTGNEPSLSVFHRSLDEAQEVIEKTPAQCLAEIRAESAEHGVYKGIYLANTQLSFANAENIEDAIMDYKNRILSGGDTDESVSDATKLHAKQNPARR